MAGLAAGDCYNLILMLTFCALSLSSCLLLQLSFGRRCARWDCVLGMIRLFHLLSVWIILWQQRVVPGLHYMMILWQWWDVCVWGGALGDVYVI